MKLVCIKCLEMNGKLRGPNKYGSEGKDLATRDKISLFNTA